MPSSSCSIGASAATPSAKRSQREAPSVAEIACRNGRVGRRSSVEVKSWLERRRERCGTGAPDRNTARRQRPALAWRPVATIVVKPSLGYRRLSIVRRSCSVSALLSSPAPCARADEGMWTFNHFPKQRVKEQLPLRPDRWLARSCAALLGAVQLRRIGVVRIARGLVMTNHHVGADCITSSAQRRDYIKTASMPRRAAEIKCPDLELNVLTSIEDVTRSVKSVEKPGMDDAAINKAQKEKMNAIEKACDRSDAPALRRRDPLSGRHLHLYKYKKYTDVRLVFAPEFEIAFFGGDPTTSISRASISTSPSSAPTRAIKRSPGELSQWSAGGAKDQELVFISGHPGNSERLDTMASWKCCEMSRTRTC